MSMGRKKNDEPPATPGPPRVGRTEPYPVLLDTIAAIDLDVQKLKALGEKSADPLKAAESGSLSNYARVLPQLSEKLLEAEKAKLEAMSTKDIKDLVAKAIKELDERGEGRPS